MARLNLLGGSFIVAVLTVSVIEPYNEVLFVSVFGCINRLTSSLSDCGLAIFMNLVSFLFSFSRSCR